MNTLDVKCLSSVVLGYYLSQDSAFSYVLAPLYDAVAIQVF